MAKLNWKKARRNKISQGVRREKLDKSFNRVLRIIKDKKKTPNKRYHPKWDTKCDAVLHKMASAMIKNGTEEQYAYVRAYQWICKKLDSGEWNKEQNNVDNK